MEHDWREFKRREMSEAPQKFGLRGYPWTHECRNCGLLLYRCLETNGSIMERVNSSQQDCYVRIVDGVMSS